MEHGNTFGPSGGNIRYGEGVERAAGFTRTTMHDQVRLLKARMHVGPLGKRVKGNLAFRVGPWACGGNAICGEAF